MKINFSRSQPWRETKKQWQMLSSCLCEDFLLAARQRRGGINNTILISKIVRLPPSSCWAGHHRRWAMVEFDSDCLIVSSSDYMGAGTHTSYTNQTRCSGNRSKWGQIKANCVILQNQNLGRMIKKSDKRWNSHEVSIVIIMLIQSSGYLWCWVHSIPYMSQNKTYKHAEY